MREEKSMAEEKLSCRSCGATFTWRSKDEEERESALAGDPAAYDPKEDCPSCRVKQDGQR